jgi:urease accessory protein
MWCENVLENIAGTPAVDRAERNIDLVDLEWHECSGLLKKQTRNGEPVRVLLPHGQRVRHGDVIYKDATCTVVIHVLPCEVIVATPANDRQAVTLALELGNLHHPTQVGNGELIFIEAEQVTRVLQVMKIPCKKEIRRFEPTIVTSVPAANVAGNFRLFRQSQ